MSKQILAESVELFKKVKKQLDVNTDWSSIEKEDFVTITEAVKSTDAAILMPQVLTGVMREAAEPYYIGTKLLEKIRMTEGNSMIIPSVGSMKAHTIGEDQAYPEESLDFNLRKSEMIRTNKTGLLVSITEEAIEESQWDMIGLHVRKGAEAMARLKEEIAFKQFSSHGHTVFNNRMRDQITELGTTGRDINGQFNNTASTEDVIDMFIAVMANGYNPTDVLMHPLSWSVFFKNDLLSSLSHGALGGSQVTNVQINPDSVSGRVPFSIGITMSPFIPFNTATKEFDMYVVDRKNIGVLLERTPLQTDQFDDPLRDVRSIKFKERYAVGILNEGKAVAVAKNLAFDKSYPDPERIKIVS